ncbi:MAG: hypothetical protein K0R59_2609 [Sphingobacterium sp.]|jgi:hypothetical protein|uniref:hypothetical protein n=1 Tax=unclassified Sphingobacterium TaxID=2609468 RepID=UPI000984E255|nr:hypothetical protein [Sphingobacterium sp. CZ-UAM]MDF2517313.1 hypothetical protein [Sphingobacterium sp.]OOG18451.1 hypothetical protein BWD42_00205 [Sphingobacterium sp. CZ-UAM]
MADSKSEKGKSAKNRSSGSEDDEIQYFNGEMEICPQGLIGTIRTINRTAEKLLKNSRENRLHIFKLLII